MKTTTTTTLRKWGNGIAVRIPSAVVKAVNLAPGGKVELTVCAQSVNLRKVLEPARIELLCAAITPENTHGETPWGEPQGREAW